MKYITTHKINTLTFLTSQIGALNLKRVPDHTECRIRVLEQKDKSLTRTIRTARERTTLLSCEATPQLGPFCTAAASSSDTQHATNPS